MTSLARRLVRAGVCVGLTSGLWCLVTTPVAYGLQPTGVSGSFSDGGHTLDYTLTGVTPDANDQPNARTGTVTAQTVTLSGTATFVIEEGFVTNLSMGASVSVGDQSDTDSWPPEGTDGVVGGTTVTFPFSLTVTVPKPPTPVPGTTPDPSASPTPYTTLSFSVNSTNCNDWGVCGGPGVTGTFQVFELPTPTSTGSPSWIAAVGAAAAVAAAAAALAANGRPTNPDPNAPAGYILQLNSSTFRVGSEMPATLQATAWKVDASGGMQPAPEAGLRIEVPAPWLQVVPGEGAGSVAGQISLVDAPTAEQVTLTVVGNAPCGEIVETVTVTVEMLSDYRAELI